MLNAMAWINKTYIVTSTLPGPSRIIDITGDDMGTSGRFESWLCCPVNLEKAFIHIWPYLKEIDGLRKNTAAVRVTKMHQEDWAVIESVSPDDVPLLDALQESNIPPHEEHIRRAEEKQEKARPARSGKEWTDGAFHLTAHASLPHTMAPPSLHQPL